MEEIFILDKEREYLERYHKGKEFYYTEEIIALIGNIQQIICQEYYTILSNNNIKIPLCNIATIKDETINAFSDRYENEYFIFVNKGVCVDFREYLETLNWEFIQDEDEKKKYIDSIIEYGFYFIVLHEYGHVFCGHTDAKLDDFNEKQAQEYIADSFAFEALLQYIVKNNTVDEWTNELEKIFLSIYLILKKWKKSECRDIYNDSNWKNFYDPEEIKKRDHPLNIQRLLYLFEDLNIIDVILPVKERIIEKIKLIKKLDDIDDEEKTMIDQTYKIVEDSITQLKKMAVDVQKKLKNRE